ncbi:MAG: translation initiation factor IF-2 [Methanothrix sp.]|nr:MAG: translation initiation factor IF-2 [Methanothrix sp.]
MKQKLKKGKLAKKNKRSAPESNLRTPIVCVMGHVDHGKTTLLDTIRGTAIADGEAGAITQHIGATEIPLDVIKDVCGPLFQGDFQVPGLLFIDTPGHHSFSSLRSRGGSLADLAVLIVDVNEGFQPQTIESLSILKRYQTPFIVAANKIDKIPGWQSLEGAPLVKSLANQSEKVARELETRTYELIGALYKHGFISDRYDRIGDFTKNIGVIPLSAVTGEGVPDLLMVLLGLAQRFLKDNLRVRASGPGVGTILEVKEEKGLGTTLDVILYEGEFHTGDTIVVGTMRDPVVTRIRALLKPRPMAEIRSEERFLPEKHVVAASGVKVSAPNIESALSGSSIRVVDRSEDVEEVASEIKSELEAVRVNTETVGVILKADTIGSLEALVSELNSKDVPIHSADVGPITRRDVIRAAAIQDPLYSALLGFNVKILPDALVEVQNKDVPVFHSDVIYRLIDSYEDWVSDEEMKMEQERLQAIIRPGAVRLMPDCMFRQSKPAVVGVQVIGGVVRTNVSLIRVDGAVVGVVKGVQEHGENIGSASMGMEVAISIDGPVVGRQIHEGDVLYVNIPEKHANILETELKSKLSEDETEVLDDFLGIKRKTSTFWAR